MSGNEKLLELQEAIAQYKKRKESLPELMKDVFLTGAVKVVRDLIDECGATQEVDEILIDLEKELI